MEDEEDAEFHAEKTKEVDEGLLEPPGHAGRVAVVAAADGLGGIGEDGQGKAAVEEFEEDHENGDADCRLSKG